MVSEKKKKKRQEEIKVSRITARGKKKKYRSKRKKRPTSSAPWKKSRDTQSVVKRKLKTFRESCNATITKVLNTSGANYKINLNRESSTKVSPYRIIRKPNYIYIYIYIYIYNKSHNKVMIAELTIPFEVNIDWAHQRELEKYEDLREQCIKKGWPTDIFPLEIGCRDFISNSTFTFLTKLRLSSYT